MSTSATLEAPVSVTADFNALAEAIAQKFNNEKVWKIETILPLFKQFPDKTPAQALGFFTKQASVPFVFAAYYVAKSGVSPRVISTDFIGRKVDDEGTRVYELIKVQDNPTSMIAEFIRVKSEAGKPTVKQLPSLNTAANAIERALKAVSTNPAEEALLKARIKALAESL